MSRVELKNLDKVFWPKEGFTKGDVVRYYDRMSNLILPYLRGRPMVLVRHPKLRLFVENSGYPYRDEMIAMMTQYPQLHGDVSTISWVLPREAFYDYLQALVRAGLGKRVMFGSDQMIWPGVIEPSIRRIERAPFLSDAQKRDILYGNAARFLRFTEAEIARHHGR